MSSGGDDHAGKKGASASRSSGEQSFAASAIGTLIIVLAIIALPVAVFRSCSSSRSSGSQDSAGSSPSRRSADAADSILNRVLRPDALSGALRPGEWFKEQFLLVAVDGGELRPALDASGNASRELYVPATHKPVYVRMKGSRWRVEVHRRVAYQNAAGETLVAVNRLFPEPFELRVAGESRWRDARKPAEFGQLTFNEFEIRLPRDYRPIGDEYFYLGVDQPPKEN